MAKTVVTIENELGLHARPAALLVQLANKFKSEIYIRKDGQRTNGKSILGIMLLEATKGSKLDIVARGSDAREAVEAVAELIKNKFGED